MREAKERERESGAGEEGRKREGSVLSADNAFIFGSGGHARVIASLIEDDYADITFVVPEPHGSDQISEAEYFARSTDHHDVPVFIGIGENSVRRHVFDRLREIGATLERCIAKDAFIARTAVLGPAAVICPGCAIMTGARIGANVIVNTLSSVDHDCRIGDHTQIAPGVSIAGGVEIGAESFLGIRSAVGPGVSIGEHVTIRAGAVVLADVPDQATVGGIPAKPVDRGDG